FRVSLPWQPAAGPPSSHGYDVAAIITDELRGVRVLVVEDDESTRGAIAMTLSQAGAIVTAVGDAEAALQVVMQPEAPEEAIDVVVSDLGLPDMTGHEMIRQMGASYRARGHHPVPACALSAHVRETDRQHAIAAG